MASNGFVNPFFEAANPAAATNWNDAPSIVFLTNSVVKMGTNGGNGKLVYIMPFQLGTAGTLFCTNGAFWNLGTQTAATNLSSGVSGSTTLQLYGTNWIVR